MKLPHALGFIAMSLCLSAGCANTRAATLASAAPVRGGSAVVGGSGGSAIARGDASERAGGMAGGSVGHDDFHVNEAATFTTHEAQFAGPTPQVPIPRDGWQGNPSTSW
ncbi:MAG: hypothetical protein Q8S73_14510 [Deltaproteobacteria bacterium]|nr:hypothetical protein [Myxococcales bacterium]MDP3215316.1 hypothetical protein [Deltaproteobacteria bacterium]